VKHRENVGAEGALQLLGADVLQPLLRVLLGGVVDQQVEPAQRADGAGDRVLAERLVADVAGNGDAAPALLLDQRLGRCGMFVLVQVDDREIGAFLGEADRDRALSPPVMRAALPSSLPAAR